MKRALLPVALAVLVAAIFAGQATGQHGAYPTLVSPGWAGFVVRRPEERFVEVEGTWTQPYVTCNRPGTSAAFWVGLGGAERDSRALEQIGTSTDCSDRYLPYDSAWYELFPAPAVDIPFAVRPGDRLYARVAVH
jgi:hypothetical protein